MWSNIYEGVFMKKSLFAVVMLLLTASKQILACDYYEDEDVLKKIIKTGAYKSKATGKVCSNDKKVSYQLKMERHMEKPKF